MRPDHNYKKNKKDKHRGHLSRGFIKLGLIGLGSITLQPASSTRLPFLNQALLGLAHVQDSSTRPHQARLHAFISSPTRPLWAWASSTRFHPPGLIGLGSIPLYPHQPGPSYPHQLGFIRLGFLSACLPQQSFIN